ncbi:MAG TPA: response regulator transcription factor [Planctomycetota bacterium]|nr:response regulator transcription factor [Planctomycetota bacterium]
MSAKILVVEDEAAIRDGVCDVLSFHGHAPMPAATGTFGLSEALTGGYDLVLLDVMLPGVDGFSICRQVRAKLPRQPVLMLTAKGAEGDVLDGFRHGADDYVVKPFSVAQLIARVDALLRRAGPRVEAPAAFEVSGLSFDPAAMRARRGGAVADLSRRDIDLIACLARNRGRIVSRRALLHEVWGYEHADQVESRCVDMHLVKLRRKLADAFGAPAGELIETVRGEGYRLNEAP